MFDASRIDIYDYLYSLFYDVVTKNVYKMSEPQELTKSDVQDGFIVVRVGDFYDNSEFSREAYGSVRCNVEVYVPTMSRGRLDTRKYKEYEVSVSEIIANEIKKTDGEYYIQDDSILSQDFFEVSNANNPFYMFVKSFIVIVDNKIV